MVLSAQWDMGTTARLVAWHSIQGTWMGVRERRREGQRERERSPQSEGIRAEDWVSSLVCHESGSCPLHCKQSKGLVQGQRPEMRLERQPQGQY